MCCLLLQVSPLRASPGSPPTASKHKGELQAAPRAKLCPTNVLAAAAISHPGWKDLSCHLHLSISQLHHWHQSCSDMWEREVMGWDREVSLQREKERDTGREELGAGFAMGEPLIPLCVAHTPRLEYRTPGIHMQAEGGKLPDSCPGMWEQQRGWAEDGEKACVKPRSVFRLQTGMQDPNSRKTERLHCF